MKSNRWDDAYTRRAQDEKWLARSVYKLEEIDKRFRLMKRGSRVLDLGCYPGSWSQYALREVRLAGDVVGIDLKRPNRLSARGFQFIQADIMAMDLERLIRDVSARDLVLSDLAPSTSGIRSADESRSLALARRAAEIAQHLLKEGGHFVCKIFEGEDFNHFKREVSGHFQQIRLIRPRATRKRSREVYLIGRDRIGPLGKSGDSEVTGSGD